MSYADMMVDPPRYEVAEDGDDGLCIVFDNAVGMVVLTNGGDIYCAPRENAQWVADRLNAVMEGE